MRRVALVAAALALAAAATAFAQVGGATYRGTHAARGSISFKLSGDGKRVVSYSIRPITADKCEFVAQGDEGVWEGADIHDGHFSYTLENAITFEGTIEGRTATGTFRTWRTAVAGERESCDSGTVAWSAATPGSDPPPLPTDGGGGGQGRTGSTTSPTGKPVVRTVRTVLVVRRRDARRITGRLSSSVKACRARRSITVIRGRRVVARAISKSDGTFTFKRTAKTRGKSVRIIVANGVLPGTVCATATKQLKG